METEYPCAQRTANEFLSTSSSGEPELHFEFAERKVDRLDIVGAIDNSTYRTVNREIARLAASKHLRKLCGCGLLVKKGNGPSTYYITTAKSLENWPPSASNTVKSPVFDSKKQELHAQKQELDGKKQELPSDLTERIAAQGKKGDKAEILDLVVDLLTVREMSTSELATHLDRTVEYVRRTYIKPLVDAGRIQSSNPDNPTDPGLTYRALLPSNRGNESEESS